MDRRTFLGRSLAAVGALSLGSLPRPAPAAPAPAEVVEVGIIRDSLINSTNSFEAFALTASGGLCAPVTPYYTLAVVDSLEEWPVRDAFPVFAADRGGIRYE